MQYAVPEVDADPIVFEKWLDVQKTGEVALPPSMLEGEFREAMREGRRGPVFDNLAFKGVDLVAFIC